MKDIDDHVQMVLCMMDDYQHMSLSGCVVVTELVFWWAGIGATRTASRTISGSSPTSSRARGAVSHPALRLDGDEPKEADDRDLAEVLKRIRSSSIG